MRQPLPACAAALRLLPLALAQVNGNGGGPSVVEAGHPSGSVQLDGKLDEPAWREAKTVELGQQAPKPGSPSPYRTKVRVLVLDNKLYFGFTLVYVTHSKEEMRRIGARAILLREGREESP